MAIVFVSPKQKQRLLIFVTIALFVVILVFITLFIFLSKPETVLVEQSSQRPDIKINFEILDSEQVKNLSVVEKIEQQFSYKATDQNKKIVNGKVTAGSQIVAEEMLKNMKFSDIYVEAISPGRVNPFIMYYDKVPIDQKDSTVKK
jgi:hypothetical protein